GKAPSPASRKSSPAAVSTWATTPPGSTWRRPAACRSSACSPAFPPSGCSTAGARPARAPPSSAWTSPTRPTSSPKWPAISSRKPMRRARHIRAATVRERWYWGKRSLTVAAPIGADSTNSFCRVVPKSLTRTRGLAYRWLMRPMFRIATVTLFLTLIAAAPAQQKKRVAVMNFDYATVQSNVSALFGSNQDIGKGIADILVDKLVNDGVYSVIERKQLDK